MTTVQTDSYRLLDDGVVTITRFLRPLQLAEILEIMDHVAAEHSNTRRAWIVSHCLSLTGDEVKIMSHRGRKLWPDGSRVAYVAADDLGYGTLRLFEAHREQDSYITRVFRDEDAALEWLRP